MDGNTTLTMGFILAIIGDISLVSSLNAKRDSMKLQEGKAQDILEITLDTMDQTMISISVDNEQFKKDHREEHLQLDKHMKQVEDYVLIQKNKSKKTKSYIEK